MPELEDDIAALERKLKQLKLDYERYFLGTRPREPIQLRAEVQKLIAVYSNQPIQNTAMRFKFSSVCSRYQAFKRQWTETLRKMDDGSYVRHRFKANLRAGGETGGDGRPADAEPAGDGLYDAYVEARRRCGQSVENLSPEKLDSILGKQRATLRKRFGSDDVRFRVVVEGGKAKLKASRER